MIYLKWGIPVILVFWGCGGGNSGGTGRLRVSLTEPPACGFDQVNVTVSEARLHRSAAAVGNDAGWTVLI